MVKNNTKRTETTIKAIKYKIMFDKLSYIVILFYFFAITFSVIILLSLFFIFLCYYFWWKDFYDQFICNNFFRIVIF
jgi:hypothetical protein